ncbi:MAG TPA: PfkB family carbohydrate kinase, partial [Methanobacterium sp.]|nr:PfkB family carbohydrate kinase [Methanobacterium sp.]
PGTALSSYGMDSLNEIIKRTNILFLNRKEVALLTGEEYDKGARNLVESGVSMVVVTCGRQGACLYTQDEVIHSPSSSIKTLDTTGAGDAFAAGFIAGFIENEEPVKCLEKGNKLASRCIGCWGSVNSNQI